MAYQVPNALLVRVCCALTINYKLDRVSLSFTSFAGDGVDFRSKTTFLDGAYSHNSSVPDPTVLYPFYTSHLRFFVDA